MLENQTLINVKNLNLTLGQNHILEKVNLKILKGKITTLIGPNGAGKSSLIRCIMGAITDYSGNIKIKPKLKIGYVPQKIDINYSLPITVNRFLNLPEKKNLKKIDTLIKNMNIIKLKNLQLNHLSKGELQRVLLAYALKDEPDLLVLDEANQGLDHEGLIKFYKKIEEIRTTSGCAVLLVSHELHIVMAASDQVICLNKNVCCEGAPDEVLESKEYIDLFGKETQGTMAIYHHKYNNFKNLKT